MKVTVLLLPTMLSIFTTVSSLTITQQFHFITFQNRRYVNCSEELKMGLFFNTVFPVTTGRELTEFFSSPISLRTI